MTVRWCDTAGGDSTRTTDAGEESVTGGTTVGRTSLLAEVYLFNGDLNVIYIIVVNSG